MAEIPAGVAGVQQVVVSPFMLALSSGSETEPGRLAYTVIATRYDEVSTPYEATFLTPRPGATVHNITLQYGCAADYSDHVSMSYSPRAQVYVQQAPEPAAPGCRDAPCVFNPPIA